MRILAITNQKGGSGKTTTAVNLAAALAEAGRAVLVLDLDPQASATAWLGGSGGGGLATTLQESGRLLDLVEETTSAPGVALISSSSDLARAEVALASQVDGATRLAELVEDLPADRWDYLLIDCPPQLGSLVGCALVAARELLIPVEASALAVSGLGALRTTVERVRRRLNPDLALTGVFACRVDLRNRISREVLEYLRQEFPDAALDATLRERVELREASGHQEPITVYRPAGDAAADFRALAAEIDRPRRRS